MAWYWIVLLVVYVAVGIVAGWGRFSYFLDENRGILGRVSALWFWEAGCAILCGLLWPIALGMAVQELRQEIQKKG